MSEGGRALVVFSGRTDLLWVRWLRPGFRHCFVALNDGRHWVTVDPLSTRVEVTVQPVPADFDLAAWYRAQGLTVVETRAASPERPAPLAIWTCVEAVKRTIGLCDRRVLTPWQLYKRLRHSERPPPSRVPGARIPLTPSPK